MGLANLLIEKHATIARIVLPTSVLFGFAYTMKNEASPYNDASATVSKSLFRLLLCLRARLQGQEEAYRRPHLCRAYSQQYTVLFYVAL